MPDQKPRWFWLILTGALLLRLVNIKYTSLWQDEIYSLMVATMHNTIPPSLDLQPHPAIWWLEHAITWQPFNWDALMLILKDNVHMPLYYVLLNPWLTVFGINALGIRLFATAFGVLMIWPLYELSKAMFDRRVALLTAFVAAVSPFQIYFSQEGRMYTLATFWAVLATLCLWKVLFSEKPVRWALGYSVSVVAGFFTHYVFVFLLGFHAYMALVTFTWPYKKADGINPRRVLWLFMGVAAVLVSAVWWFPMYVAQKHGVDEGYHFAKGSVDYLQGITAPFWQAFVTLGGDNEIVRVLYAILFFGLLAFVFLRQRLNYPGFLYKLTLTACGITIPIWGMFVYDIYNQSHTCVIDRYGTLVAPMAYLLLALLIENFIRERTNKKNLAIVLGVMTAVAVAAVWAPGPLRDEHNKKDIRDKMHYMAAHAGKNDLILATGVSGAPVLGSYYLKKRAPQQPIIYWVNELRGKSYELPSVESLKKYDTIWVLKLRATEERGGEEMDRYMRSNFPHWKHKHHWDIYQTR